LRKRKTRKIVIQKTKQKKKKGEIKMAAETIGNSKIAALATVIAAKSLETLHGRMLASQIVRNDYRNEVATVGQVVSINKYAAGFVANNKTENANVTVQDRTSTLVPVTLNQHKEATFIVEDVTRAMSSVQLLVENMQEAIVTLAESVDDYVFGLHAGFSVSPIDATGAAGPIAQADFITASTALNKANVPFADRFAILSADDHALVSEFAELKNRDYTGDSAILANAGQALPLYKTFTPVMSNFVKTASSEYKNMFIHKSAIALVSRPLPLDASIFGGATQVVMEENGISIRVTLSYNPDKLGVQCTVDTLFGAAVLDANRGRIVRTTAA
jgi:hypothetical protein